MLSTATSKLMDERVSAPESGTPAGMLPRVPPSGMHVTNSGILTRGFSSHFVSIVLPCPPLASQEPLWG